MKKEESHWFSRFNETFSSATSHMLVLWGNIYDLQRSFNNGKYLSLMDYLVAIMKNRKLIMFYSLSSGLEFPSEKLLSELGVAEENRNMEKVFRERYIKTPPPAETTQSATQAARNGLNNTQKDKVPLHQHVGETPDRALKFLERALMDTTYGERQSVLIINSAHNIALGQGQGQSMGDRIATEILERWANDERIKNARSMIVLITPSLRKLSEGLCSAQSGVTAIRIPKPSEDDRIDRWSLAIKENGNVLSDNLDQTTLGRITNGLSFKQIDSISRLNKDGPISLALVKERKREILEAEFGDRIKVIVPKWGFSHFGGKQYLKDYAQELISNILKGMNRRVPMGVLAAGPPGTGKTFFFECLAYECGFNFVEIVNPRSMWVGQSEDMLERVFAAFDDLSPVIVLEDEADQSEPSRDEPSGDSGVSNRMRQMKFKFTSDPKRRGKVIWVRISNRPDKIDAAYKREGRSDDTIPFLMPEKEEYSEIFQVMFKRYEIPHQISDFNVLAGMVAEKKYCSGASVEWMVLEADKYAGRAGSDVVKNEHVLQAIGDWQSKNDPTEINRQVVLCLENSSKRLRPANWQATYDFAKANMD